MNIELAYSILRDLQFKNEEIKNIYLILIDEKSETADTLATVLKTFKEQKLNDITEINLKNKSNITIRYQNRITLKFGSVANFENKVKLAIKSLENENEISFDQKGVLDLRVYGEAVFSPSEE